MDLRKNIATFFQRFAKQRGLSMAKLQSKADISRNMLHSYVHGKGNPRLSTLEYLARNLEVDPICILLGISDPDGKKVSVLLLNTVRGMLELTPEEQRQFLRQFAREMVRLWDME